MASDRIHLCESFVRQSLLLIVPCVITTPSDTLVYICLGYVRCILQTWFCFLRSACQRKSQIRPDLLDLLQRQRGHAGRLYENEMLEAFAISANEDVSSLVQPAIARGRHYVDIL